MEESIDFDNESLAGFQAIENAAAGTESIKVLVRIRPLNETEKNVDGENSSLMITSPQSLTIKTYDNRKTYNCSYDTVLGPSASQAQVYDTVKDCTLSVMQGVNSTIFAYGQTGSGKTHSMYGPPNYVSNQLRETEMLGVIPRAIHHIFELARNPKIIQFQVHCSFVQIYNENLFDMLRDSSMNTPLTIREDSYTKEIYVQGLSEYNVKSVTDTLQLLKIAEDNRAIRETHMNQFSSRSHSIFTINIEQKCVAPDGGEISLRSKFNLVDLAGSEKWDLSKDLRDAHIQEMNNINLSLHTLGKCISSLAKASRKKQKEFLFEKQQQQQNDNKSANSLEKSFNSSVKVNRNELSTASTREKVIHVPFRESKLTRLLQDSLGGNAKTLLIATISPAK
jgi:kinesin family protein 3/17